MNVGLAFDPQNECYNAFRGLVVSMLQLNMSHLMICDPECWSYQKQWVEMIDEVQFMAVGPN